MTYAAHVSKWTHAAVGQLAQAAYHLIALGYNEDFEFDADEYAFRGLLRKGRSRDQALAFPRHFAKYVLEKGWKTGGESLPQPPRPSSRKSRIISGPTRPRRNGFDVWNTLNSERGSLTGRAFATDRGASFQRFAFDRTERFARNRIVRSERHEPGITDKSNGDHRSGPDCDIVVNDPSVSTRHCRLVRDPGEYTWRIPVRPTAHT